MSNVQLSITFNRFVRGFRILCFLSNVQLNPPLTDVIFSFRILCFLSNVQLPESLQDGDAVLESCVFYVMIVFMAVL